MALFLYRFDFVKRVPADCCCSFMRETERFES